MPKSIKPKKKHAPIKELRKAAKFANQKLVELGFQAKESIIEKIEKEDPRLILPGPPGRRYIPRPWEINAARRIIYDIARMYEVELKAGKYTTHTSIDEFFKFSVGVMQDMLAENQKQIEKTVKEEEYDFKTLHTRDAIRGMNQLIVDSFAISIILKENTDVANYIGWFMEWTESLIEKWSPDIRHIDGKQPEPSLTEKLNKIELEQEP